MQQEHPISYQVKRYFQERLLEWYRQRGRDLPWRHTQDPYKILVSEIMLHQTQVDRVIPKYCEWIKIFPTFKALADTPLEYVKRFWKPLGYNFRPERLHKIAKYVTDELDGKLPDTMEELISLNGIGRYTAGAILNFAFHKDAPIVDTNVRRILQRVFGIQGNPMREPAKRKIWRIAKAIIPEGKGHIFNQALMDLGALKCTSRRPACASCFLQEICQWKNSQDLNLHT